MILIVVPEFSVLMISSGSFRLDTPRVLIESSSFFVDAPKALHAVMVAVVSLEIRGLEMSEAPSERDARVIALCV